MHYSQNTPPFDIILYHVGGFNKCGGQAMVYLIHFDKPYKHARHYIGFTDNLEQRIHDHEYTCKGARLLQVVREAGIEFKVVRTWPDGDRNFERKLHNRKKSSTLCPICQAKTAGRRDRSGK
jgi:hypothetical protein